MTPSRIWAKGNPKIVMSLIVFEWSEELADEIMRGFLQLRATDVRFCIRLDLEAKQRAYSETCPTLSAESYHSSGLMNQALPTQDPLPPLPAKEQIRWFP